MGGSGHFREADFLPCPIMGLPRWVSERGAETERRGAVSGGEGVCKGPEAEAGPGWPQESQNEASKEGAGARPHSLGARVR